MKTGARLGIIFAICTFIPIGKAVAVVPILVQIGVYIAGTATIAAALAKFSESLRNIYDNVVPIIDQQTCRSHKNALNGLVFDLRELESQKKHSAMSFMKSVSRLGTTGCHLMREANLLQLAGR